MTEQSNKREVWFKCYSMKKKMIYYWNSETRDSFWEDDSQERLKKPNVDIFDKSEEMKKGKVPTYCPTNDTIAKPTIARPPNGIKSKSQLQKECEEEDDDDDDEDFNDTLNAYYESSHSSSSACNGSQGLLTKSEASSGVEKRHSELTPKCNATEKVTVKRSLEIPPVKPLTPKTSARREVKSPTNHGKRSLSDTSLSSTSSQKPYSAPKIETSVAPSKLMKKDILKQPLRGRLRTPIQDRKMKEKEELLQKQKKKSNSLGAHNSPNIIAGSGGAPLLCPPVVRDIRMKVPQNFVIPKRKVFNTTPDRKSEGEPRVGNQRPSPQQGLPKPQVPKKVPTATTTAEPGNVTQYQGRPNDKWLNKVWSTPPPVLVGTNELPMPAVVPVPLPPMVTVPSLVPSSSSERAQKTDTTHFKNPAPVVSQNFVRRVRCRRAPEGHTSKLDSVEVQKQMKGIFKDPSPVLMENTVSGKDSSGESNKTKFDSDRDTSCTTNGMRKRLKSDGDDRDSDDSDTENFKRTRSSIGTHNSGSTLTTSHPSTRLTFDTPSPSPSHTRQTSAVTGPTLDSTRSMSTPFDARQVLERRRKAPQCGRRIDTSSCLSQDDNAMEWESVQESHNLSIQERLGQPRQEVQHSTSRMMCSLHYKPLVIVCDTNALIHDFELVEELVEGTVVGLPVTVVVPYQVFRELDSMKEHQTQEVSGGARAAIRMINEIILSESQSHPNFVLQNISMHRKKAKEVFELEKNDDFVLNCALQQQAAQGRDRIVILLTGDKHLQILAKVNGITSQTPKMLKGWARVYKEKVRQQAMGDRVESPLLFSLSDSPQPDVKMDVDPDPGAPLAPVATESPSDRCTPTEKSRTNKFYAELLTDELLQFLKTVIEKCNEREYAALKRHASQPRPSWSLVHCLVEVVRRWNIVTGKKLSPAMNTNIKNIIGLAKKYNKGKEEFTKSEMKTYFTSIQTLVREFVDLYDEVSGFFLTRLYNVLEEWEQKANISTASPCEEEDDAQPADIALQNIYNCMRSDYETWKETVEREKFGDKKALLETSLKAFHSKVTNMLRIIKDNLEERPHSSMTADDECILAFHKATSVFIAENGDYLTFDLTGENILALFQESGLRKRVKEMIEKITILQSDVMDLLEELSTEDSDDDFDC